MIEETDVHEEKEWWYQNLAQITVANFRKRSVNTEYVSTRHEALRRVLELIPKDATVGWGDSVTLHQLGVVSELKKANTT